MASLSIISMAAGSIPAAMMPLTAARFVGGRKRGKQRADACRALDDAQNDLRGDAQGAFGADKDAGKVIAGRIERFPTEMHERAVGKNNFQAEDVRGGEAVLEAMRAAGVFRDVAADAANRLRRRIGCVEIILGRDATGDVQVDDSGLYDNTRVRKVHLVDAIHACQAQDNAVGDRQRTTAQARARTARNERNFFAMAEAHDGLHLLGGRRKQNRAWQYAKIREAVAFVGVQFLRRADEPTLANDRSEFVEKAKIQGPYLTPFLHQTSLPHYRMKFNPLGMNCGNT